MEGPLSLVKRYLYWSCIWRNRLRREERIDSLIEGLLADERYEECVPLKRERDVMLEIVMQSSCLMDPRRVELVIADI